VRRPVDVPPEVAQLCPFARDDEDGRRRHLRMPARSCRAVRLSEPQIAQRCLHAFADNAAIPESNFVHPAESIRPNTVAAAVEKTGQGRGRGTALLAESEFRQRNPNARLVCLDVQPNQTTQAAEPGDILNMRNAKTQNDGFGVK